MTSTVFQPLSIKIQKKSDLLPQMTFIVLHGNSRKLLSLIFEAVEKPASIANERRADSHSISLDTSLFNTTINFSAD